MKQTLHQNLETRETEASKNQKDTTRRICDEHRKAEEWLTENSRKAYNKKQKIICVEQVCVRIISGSFSCPVIH